MNLYMAIYDDSSKEVPFRCFHSGTNTIYRTANMGFVEELTGQGFEPTVILLEEDIDEIKGGTYTNADIGQSGLDFLRDNWGRWALGAGFYDKI